MSRLRWVTIDVILDLMILTCDYCTIIRFGTSEASLDSVRCGRDTVEESMPLYTWSMLLITRRSKEPGMNYTTFLTNRSYWTSQFWFLETNEICQILLTRRSSLSNCKYFSFIDDTIDDTHALFATVTWLRFRTERYAVTPYLVRKSQTSTSHFSGSSLIPRLVTEPSSWPSLWLSILRF